MLTLKKFTSHYLVGVWGYNFVKNVDYFFLIYPLTRGKGSIFSEQHETTKDEKVRLSQADIWEKNLNFYLIPMVKAYIDRFILSTYINWLTLFDSSPNEKQLFTNLALIGLQNQIIDDAIYFKNILEDEQIETLKESWTQLNKEMK